PRPPRGGVGRGGAANRRGAVTPAVRAAALGAAAGLAGALAMLVAGTLEDRKTGRHAAGANLMYAAVLGAAYGLLRSRMPRRPAARAALVSALSYAM
ncbi:MAG: hypothetical protein ACREOC_09175, partial [Gemmatimonadales bacterium]